MGSAWDPRCQLTPPWRSVTGAVGVPGPGHTLGDKGPCQGSPRAAGGDFRLSLGSSGSRLFLRLAWTLCGAAALRPPPSFSLTVPGTSQALRAVRGARGWTQALGLTAGRSRILQTPRILVWTERCPPALSHGDRRAEWLQRRRPLQSRVARGSRWGVETPVPGDNAPLGTPVVRAAFVGKELSRPVVPHCLTLAEPPWEYHQK